MKELELDTNLPCRQGDLAARAAELMGGRVNHEIGEIFSGRNIQRGV